MEYDLFISYARRDNTEGRVTELVNRIREDFAAFASRPLNPFFDVDEIGGMEDWRHRILRGLRESRLMLACLSPAYLDSDYCEWEFTEYVKYETGRPYMGEGVAPIYFVEVPGWDEPGFETRCKEWVAELLRRQQFDLRPWHREGADALRDGEVRRRMGELGGRIADRIRLGEEAGRRLGNVETHNPHFVGRTSEMRRIHESVMLGRMGVLTAVHGMGGVGKTALATEYAHAFAAGYGGGRWLLRCEGREDLPGTIALLAAPLGVTFTEPEQYDVALQYQRVIAELRRLVMENEPHHALLLLDNVDRPKLLEPAQTGQLPDGDWLHLLATTRLTEKELHKEENEALSDRVFVAVDELPEEDALSLIESHQRGGRFRDAAERDAAREIVRLLGGFTLAVEEAAVYLGRYPEVTCAAFLARLRREGLEGLDNAAGQSGAGVRHGEIRLDATLRPMLERLSAAERLVMDYAALLPPDHAALPWLRELAAAVHPELGRDAEPGYPDPWRDVLRRLMGLRLLLPAGAPDADGQPRLVRVHRLVQQLVGRDAPPELRADRQKALDALVETRVAVLNQTTAWTEARWEVLPLDALANMWGDMEHPGASWLMNEVGRYWYTLAEWTRAEPLMRRVLDIDKATFGPEHPNVATALSNLAQLLKATNRLEEAEKLMRRALAIYEAAPRPKHPDVAMGLNNLAVLLYTTNRLEEAEKLMRRALDITEVAYGPEHPEVATCLNNLAQLLQATNRLVEAEKLMLQALAIDEGTYGSKHPKVVIDLNNLAQLLQKTNRLAEAEKLMLQALAIDEGTYGSEHPNVAIRLNNLALLLYVTNRLAEAEPLMRRSVFIYRLFFERTGHSHPYFYPAVINYLSLLNTQGMPADEARAKTLEASGLSEEQLDVLLQET